MNASNSSLGYYSSFSSRDAHEKFITMKFMWFEASTPKGNSTSNANFSNTCVVGFLWRLKMTSWEEQWDTYLNFRTKESVRSWYCGHLFDKKSVNLTFCMYISNSSLMPTLIMKALDGHPQDFTMASRGGSRSGSQIVGLGELLLEEPSENTLLNIFFLWNFLNILVPK